MRDLARAATTDGRTDGDEPGTAALLPFVRQGRLRSLPAQRQRRAVVLRHIAEATFDLGQRYDEPAVDDRLRAWCDGGEVDHVTVRRYLIDAGLLVRAGGVYTRPAEVGS